MHASQPDRSDWYAPVGMSRLGLVSAVALHALAILGLLRTNAEAWSIPPVVLSASLLPAIKLSDVEQAFVPSQPKHVTPQTLPPQPTNRLATSNETPAQPVTASSTPQDQTTSSVSPAPTEASAALSQPRFDADYLDNPTPPYPTISRRLGEQGRVMLRVRVGTDGQALDVQLHASSGSARLDLSALETVRRWRFVPARLGTEPIAATVLVPIVFSLKD